MENALRIIMRWFKAIIGSWFGIKGSRIWTRSMTYSYHMQVRIKMR